jgi:hypothetical protein
MAAKSRLAFASSSDNCACRIACIARASSRPYRDVRQHGDAIVLHLEQATGDEEFLLLFLIR